MFLEKNTNRKITSRYLNCFILISPLDMLVSKKQLAELIVAPPPAASLMQSQRGLPNELSRALIHHH